MNRAQLDALLAVGLITATQHAAAVKTLAAGSTPMPTLQLSLAATGVRLAEGDEQTGQRTIRATVCKYEYLIPSHNMILHTGALEPRDIAARDVKMLRDHNHSDPVGYMTEFDAATLDSLFYIPEGENGDRALAEAENGLRDGISVGFTILEYSFDEDWVMHVTRADFYEASLCAIPAIADAGVTNVAAALATAKKENTIMNRAQLAAALKAGHITQETYDAEIAKLDAAELAARPPVAASFDGSAAAVPAELAAGPVPLESHPPVGYTSPRGLSLKQAVSTMSAAFNTGTPSQVMLALADIIPANDAGQGFLRDDWFGELWTANSDTRPFIDAFGIPSSLDSLKGKGWRWKTRPKPALYAGDKVEVPTGPALTEEDTFTAKRAAGGWDIDRAFVDFADEAFLNAFWAAAVAEYKSVSNAIVGTDLLAAATTKTGTVTTGGVLAVLKQVIRDGRAVPGGKVNRIFLGDDLFAELEDLPTENLPLWLKSAVIGLDIAEGTADVGQLRIINDNTKLAAKQVLAADNRAVIVREKSPIQVKAFDVAHAGIDLGFYSYLRVDDHDPRLLFKRTYAPA